MSYYEDLLETIDNESITQNNKPVSMKQKYCFIEKYRDSDNKRKKREIWATGQAGTRIRDAKTGYITEYIVGSNDEKLFFKVMHCTGKFGQEPLTLFYDSPEAYESHFMTSLSTEIKEKWNINRQKSLSTQ